MELIRVGEFRIPLLLSRLIGRGNADQRMSVKRGNRVYSWTGEGFSHFAKKRKLEHMETDAVPIP